MFYFVEKHAQSRRPAFGRHGLEMVEFDKLTKRLQFYVEPWAILIVEVAELDERVECLTCSWKRAISNHIKLRFGRAVAVACQVMTSVLEALF